MPGVSSRLLVLGAVAVGLVSLSACNKSPDASAPAGQSMSDNGGAMASNESMVGDENAMSAGESNGGSMQSSDGMQKNSH